MNSTVQNNKNPKHEHHSPHHRCSHLNKTYEKVQRNSIVDNSHVLLPDQNVRDLTDVYRRDKHFLEQQSNTTPQNQTVIDTKQAENFESKYCVKENYYSIPCTCDTSFVGRIIQNFFDRMKFGVEFFLFMGDVIQHRNQFVEYNYPFIPHSTCSNEMATLNEIRNQLNTRPTPVPTNARWTQNGVTVAGGNRSGSATYQLSGPFGVFVADDQTIVIADSGNHRVIESKTNENIGKVVAGDNGLGNRLNQLNFPTDVLIDRRTDSLIICDRDNRRVVRWSRRHGTTQGEILIDSIACNGLAMDDQKYLYISDYKKHEVRRYRMGDKNGILVAGGNGRGDELNQLSGPTSIFIGRQQTVYVSDNGNNRVMKWIRGAKEGIIVAGGQDGGDTLRQLYWPNGLFVDTFNTLYVADSGNHRVMRWPEGAKQGTVILGGNGCGVRSNQFNYLRGLSFDSHGNLYVVDHFNHRVQQFSLERTSNDVYIFSNKPS
ncbi:unnamed protein product [Rotaria socialis]|uniref:Uncharacterized protein n=1 Tax=Rotaria socialis TaxID=392032 RepID=A0A820XJS9_9BILA|nr:unnamed protein product [Rotaria socialis]